MRLVLLAAAAASALSVAEPAAFAADASAPAIVHYGTWGVDLTTEDKSVAPGDNFFLYGEGGWLAKAVIPPDQTSTGSGRAVRDRTELELKTLIETAAKDPKTPEQAKIGGLYAAFMDEPRLEELDAKPLKADLAAIAAAPDKAAMSLIMAKTYGGFGKSMFAVGILPDPKHPDINSLFIGQDGLGLPDRDYYLKPEFKAQRDAYLAYIQRTFEMLGYPDPAASAAAVLAFETRIAEVSWAADERRDIEKMINPITLDELQAYAPQINWRAHLAAAGLPPVTKLVAGEKSAIQKIATIYGETPLSTLKAWETFQTADSAAPYLSKRFVDSHFELAKALSGVTTDRPRWKRGVDLVDGSLGEVLGRAYVEAYFPPESKAKIQDLVANLKTAMGRRIENAAWMAPSTKAEALKKLAKMDVQVGYPDKWRDYSGLRIDPTDLYGDVERSEAFEWAYGVSDLGKAVDHKKWGMTPQTVNAYNGGLENRIVFPAAILQAPFFDASADPAVNYGAAGAIIGHEITHGFDDQGRKIDDTGAVRDWWTPEDAKRFQEQAARLGAQYDTYEPLPGFHVNGKLTMGENIADLGGLLEALDAYHASLHGHPAPVIDGLTGDQRFFLAFAQAWQNKTRPENAKQRLTTDPHSPPEFRAIGPTRNMDAWYAAFSVTSGKYALKPEDRARIW
jgi:putative endopeptidase